MRKPYPPNNFCPCKSGKKYKQCCLSRNIEYFVKPGGKVIRERTLTDEQREEFKAQVAAFKERYGRAPNEEEEGLLRLSGGFSDLTSVIEKELLASGAAPEVIYAYRKTGLLIARDNQQQVTPDELIRWEQALQEYRQTAAKSGH